ncbi:MAG: hypothetical protein ACOYOK_11430, partial [Pseudobdellovibrionaceae bacterium]
MKASDSNKEFNFLHIVQMYKKLWRWSAIIFASFMFLGLLLYVFVIPQSATVRILVNDPQNSSLQAFSNQY